MANSRLTLDSLKEICCQPITVSCDTTPSVTFHNGGISMANTTVMTKTVRQFEIEEELKELRRQIDALEAEYDEERLTAEAEYAAHKHYVKYEALVNAGFTAEQAFSMLEKEEL